MNSASGIEKSDARRLVEASAWRTHLTETDLNSSPEFEAWLAQDDKNKCAWDHVQDSWSLFGEQATAPELLELRRRALSQARTAGRQRWNTERFGSRWKPFAVAASVSVLTLAVLLVWTLGRSDVYRTGAGERRVVTLTDGSQIQLDALTELEVDYSEQARDLTLVKGQARFDVAHDVERPFSVVAAGRKVVALGTTFNVDLLGRDLFITLIEGRVAILPKNPPPSPLRGEGRGEVSSPSDKPIELNAGEQLAVSASGATQVKPANLRRASAWQSGQLVFDDEPLSSVIVRINRYASRPLSLTDEHTASLRISGVFNTGDTEGFVSTITHYLPVKARQGRDSILIGPR